MAKENNNYLLAKTLQFNINRLYTKIYHQKELFIKKTSEEKRLPHLIFKKGCKKIDAANALLASTQNSSPLGLSPQTLSSYNGDNGINLPSDFIASNQPTDNISYLNKNKIELTSSKVQTIKDSIAKLKIEKSNLQQKVKNARAIGDNDLAKNTQTKLTAVCKKLYAKNKDLKIFALIDGEPAISNPTEVTFSQNQAAPITIPSNQTWPSDVQVQITLPDSPLPFISESVIRPESYLNLLEAFNAIEQENANLNLNISNQFTPAFGTLKSSTINNAQPSTTLNNASTVYSMVSNERLCLTSLN
jgi:hypothetical protein